MKGGNMEVKRRSTETRFEIRSKSTTGHVDGTYEKTEQEVILNKNIYEKQLQEKKENP